MSPVVLALDALEDGCDNKRRYRRQERRSRGDAGAPVPSIQLNAGDSIRRERHRQQREHQHGQP